ncbi:fimbrial biogenesis chaperone [Lutibacter sp.]
MKSILLVVLVLLSITNNSYSFDFTIQPIKLKITKEKITTTFTIINKSDKRIAIETEIRKWDQNEKGEYIYTPTDSIVVVPPYIELEGKQKQVIRIAYLGDFENPLEMYRMYLRQVPLILKPKEELKEIKTSIQILLNLSVPVFVIRDNNLDYKLSIEPVSKSKKKVTLKIKNSGTGYAKIKRVELYKGKNKIDSFKYVKYILPGKAVNLDISIRKLGKNGKYYFVDFKDIPDKIKLVITDKDDYEKEIILDI